MYREREGGGGGGVKGEGGRGMISACLYLRGAHAAYPEGAGADHEPR